MPGMTPADDAQLLGIDVDAVTPLVPGDDPLDEGCIAGIAHKEIAVDDVVAPIGEGDALLQRRGDGGRAAKVHVGHAHAGDDLGHMLVADRHVPMHAVGADAIERGVEIEFARRRRGDCFTARGQAGRQRTQRQDAAAQTRTPQK